MSILIALIDGADTVIACDGRRTWGTGCIDSDSTDKWIESVTDGRAWAIGTSGSWRAATVIRSPILLEKIGWASAEDAAVLIRSALRDDGWLDKGDDGKPRWFDFEAVIARAGEVVRIDGTACVDPIEDFVCIGSGADYARGALMALQDSAFPAEDRVRIAVDIAVRCDNACGGTVRIRRLRAA